MNREFLKGLGIDDEHIEKVMAEHGKSITKVKEDLTSAQSELETVKGQLTERDAQLDELSKKAEGNEALTAEIERLKADNEKQLEALKADALKAKKDALLVKAGYTEEQVAVLRKSVDGETDEELTQSIEALKTVIAPKPTYVDPGAMNGQRDKPEPKDGEEVGKAMYERIKHRLRG